MFLPVFAQIIRQCHHGSQKDARSLDHNHPDVSKIKMCKIPDCLDPVLHQNICHFLGLILRKSENCDLYVIFSQEEWKFAEHLDLKSANRNAFQHRIYVKDSYQLKSPFSKST